MVILKASICVLIVLKARATGNIQDEYINGKTAFGHFKSLRYIGSLPKQYNKKNNVDKYREKKNIYIQKKESTGKGNTKVRELHLILSLLSSHLLFQFVL